MYFKFNDFELIKQELKTETHHRGIESMQAVITGQIINKIVFNVYNRYGEKTIYKLNGVNPAKNGIHSTPK